MKTVLSFQITQSKTNTFTNLNVTRKPVRPVKSLKNKIANDHIYMRFLRIFYDIKTKGHDVVGVNMFLRKIMRFLRKKMEKNIPAILLL